MNPNYSVLIRIFEDNGKKQFHYVTVEVHAASEVEASNQAHEFMEEYDDESYYEIVKVSLKP